MPYNYDRYPAGPPFQPYYQQQMGMMQGQGFAPQPQISVNVPQRQPQNYPQPQDYVQPQPQPQFVPQYQNPNQQQQQTQQAQQQQFAPRSALPTSQPQYYTSQIPLQDMQRAYLQNQQVHQRYQPPPPPRVVVPPRQSFQVPPKSSSQQRPEVEPLTSSPAQMSTKTPSSQHCPLQDINPNKTQPQMSAKAQPTSKVDDLATECPSVLLALADEYIDAAKKLDRANDDYYKLLSTALTCIQAVSKNFKLAPLREAQLTLKYAQILHDETDNIDEAETILTKSIEFCERMKFVDLKYAMQLLLAKVLFRSKPRAAIRDIQRMIQDIETYRHVAWEYAFRFQAVFFLTEMSATISSQHEIIIQLEAIQHLARQNTDYAVYTFAAILESLLHLQHPSPESTSHSQAALAKARSLQLNPDVEGHPQLPVMMDLIDMMWDFDTQADKQTTEQKRKNLRKSLYQGIDDPAWSTGDLIWLRINTKSLKGVPTQETGLVHERDGNHHIVLSWISAAELEAIGFLFHAYSNRSHNWENGKSVSFSSEGCRVLKEDVFDKRKTISVKDDSLRRRCHITSMYMQIEAAFINCTRGQWSKAEEAVEAIQSHLRELRGEPDEEIEAVVEYLRGCIQQGTGNLDAALDHFLSKRLKLTPQISDSTPTSKNHRYQAPSTTQNLRILAALNSALIVTSPAHPQHKHREDLMTMISNHMTAAAPPLITSAYALVTSVTPDQLVTETKQLLSHSLTNAKKCVNHQIQGLILTLMQDRYFRGGVQDSQAVKCAMAASHSVKVQWGNPLWMAVSGTFEVESLKLQQDPLKQESLERKVQEVHKTWQMVPSRVRQELQTNRN